MFPQDISFTYESLCHYHDSLFNTMLFQNLNQAVSEAVLTVDDIPFISQLSRHFFGKRESV